MLLAALASLCVQGLLRDRDVAQMTTGTPWPSRLVVDSMVDLPTPTPVVLNGKIAFLQAGDQIADDILIVRIGYHVYNAVHGCSSKCGFELPHTVIPVFSQVGRADIGEYGGQLSTGQLGRQNFHAHPAQLAIQSGHPFPVHPWTQTVSREAEHKECGTFETGVNFFDD